MDLKYAKYLINKTKRDYDIIAADFSASRRYPWPEMKEMAKRVKPGSKVIDIGCGNGRLLSVLGGKKVKYLGMDFSKKLIELARQAHQVEINRGQAEFRVQDILEISPPEEALARAKSLASKDKISQIKAFNASLPNAKWHHQFEVAFCLAVLNHIPSKPYRTLAFLNLNHLLKDDGLLIISTWNLFQKKYLFFIINYLLARGGGESQFDPKDTFIPWEKSGRKILRYYHSFTRRELKKYLAATGFKVEELYYSNQGQRANFWTGRNLIAVARKIKDFQ